MYRKYYIALSEVIIILTATVLFACMLVPAAGTAGKNGMKPSVSAI